MNEQMLSIALSDRYLAAFRRLEGALRELARNAGVLVSADGRDRDMIGLIELAEIRRWVQPEAARFLHSCRRARNAFTHIDFEGYAGPAALPPKEVVHRIERIAMSLENPPKARTVSQPAMTCTHASPIGEVLMLMHERDFSQVPFRSSEGAWELVTHQTVSRWASAEAGTESDCLLDLRLPVSQVVEAAGMRCRPTVRGSDASVTELIADLEAAVKLPDDAVGGYGAVLVEVGEGGSLRIFVPDDLPRAYDVVGR